MIELGAVAVYFLAFGLSALAGLAVLLKSQRAFSSRNVVSSCLYTGLLGFAITAVLLNYFPNQVWPVLGTAVISGLSGMKAIDVLRYSLLRLLEPKNEGDDDDS